jgi:enoyl-CoA hydratase/carnithine racemase
MGALEEFLADNPDLPDRLHQGARSVYRDICASMAHLRSRQAKDFFIRTLIHLEAIQEKPLEACKQKGALRLSRLNWALVTPYFDALRSLPGDEKIIRRWTLLAENLARRDIDVALAFLQQTPRALATLEVEDLWTWGQQALAALKSENRVWKPVRAYLEESAANRCSIPLTRWQFYLEQADRICGRSPTAAQTFIRHGNRACLLLTDAETVQWVTDGLEECRTEEELDNFFSGTSLKALEKRDGLISGVSLKERGNTLSLICEAILGHPVRIRSNTALVGQKGFSGGAATDGRTIFLPDMVPDSALMKLMALHQAMFLEREHFLERAGKIVFDPIALHLDADRRMLDRLPNLRGDMDRTAGGLPPGYPEELTRGLQGALPWWGDILPQLCSETDTTIRRIQEKAEEYGEVPPELVESLLAVMMADGERDPDALWEMFREMLDNMVFESPDAEELQENVKTFFYKEWDSNLCDYKMDWCLVRHRIAAADPNAFVADIRSRLHGIIGLIRRQFARLKPERFKKFRAQPTGDGLDIEALVEAVVDMRCGASLSENVYIRRDKRVRDVAVLFLLDLSGSTEEKVDGRRVIDVQKEAMALMAEALDALDDPYAIYGFSSEGRHRVDLFTVKDFAEPYGEEIQYRLGNLEPLGLTRMGAVLRHGLYKLDASRAAVKLMVILTDGRPYDLEYGNLDYAIADTRKAMREIRQKRIHPFIITTDQKSSDYLKRIAPETQSIIVQKVEQLPRLLPAIYKRLTA